MQDLKISIIQTNLHWEDAGKNLKQFARLIDDIECSDLILLPEMFSSGFSMHPEGLADHMDGRAMQWLADQSAKKQCAICGSLIIEDQDNFYNRLVFMRPDGQYEYYDKRHLFRMAQEHQHYSEGTQKRIIEWRDWRLCPLVCYDLRFPVWSRNYNNEYDLLIYVANWPAKRDYAWRSLLIARAIENLSYVVGVNRIGQDGNGIDYTGSSLLVSMKGEVIDDLKSAALVKTICLSADALGEYRERFPAYLDADRFTINV